MSIREKNIDVFDFEGISKQINLDKKVIKFSSY